MIKRTLTGAIILAVFIAMFFARLIPFVGLYLFDMFLGALTIICSMEMSKILKEMGYYHYGTIISVYPSLMYVSHLLCLLFNASIILYIVLQLLIIIGIFLFSVIYSYTSSAKTNFELSKIANNVSYTEFSIRKALNTTIGCLYPSLFMLALFLINRFDELDYVFTRISKFDGRLSLLVVLLVIMIPILSDTFSYITGKLIGGPKIFPKTSPNKTIAGTCGGLVLTSLVCGLVFFIFDTTEAYRTIFLANGFKMFHFMILGFFGSVIGQAGDYFESFLKRQAGVKDSGDWLGAHGGFLDRLDSHIFHAFYVFVFFLILI